MFSICWHSCFFMPMTHITFFYCHQVVYTTEVSDASLFISGWFILLSLTEQPIIYRHHLYNQKKASKDLRFVPPYSMGCMHITERTARSLIENFLCSLEMQSFLLWPIPSLDLPPSDVCLVKKGWHNQGKQRWSQTQPQGWEEKIFRPLSKGRRTENLYPEYESICNSQAWGSLPVCWLWSAALAAPISPRPWSQILTQQVWGRARASAFLKSRGDWRSLL